jgi:hypothetical protein
MAAAYVQTNGRGTESALAGTAKDVFSEHGWVDKCNIQMPKLIGKQLHILVNQTYILMLGIGGFAGNLRGAYRRDAFLINPLADVRGPLRGVMRRFCTDSMAGCVTTLIEGLHRASLMHIHKMGKWSEVVLYPTEMAQLFKSTMGPEVDSVPVDAAGLKVWESTQSQRFQRNIIKAQWAVAQIVRRDMAESLVKWFDHELYCILADFLGFRACSLEKARKKDDPDRHTVDVLGTAGCEQVCSGEPYGRL